MPNFPTILQKKKNPILSILAILLEKVIRLEIGWIKKSLPPPCLGVKRLAEEKSWNYIPDGALCGLNTITVFPIVVVKSKNP